MLYTYFDSPLGRLFLAKDSEGLRLVKYAKNFDPAKIPSDWKEDSSSFQEEEEQFGEYFEGKRSYFSLKIAPEGTTFPKKRFTCFTENTFWANAYIWSNCSRNWSTQCGLVLLEWLTIVIPFLLLFPAIESLVRTVN